MSAEERENLEAMVDPVKKYFEEKVDRWVVRPRAPNAHSLCMGARRLQLRVELATAAPRALVWWSTRGHTPHTHTHAYTPLHCVAQ